MYKASKDSKSRATQKEKNYQIEMEEHIKSAVEKFGYRNTMDRFAKYASRQSITSFLARDEIFKKILKIHGSIIECGVYAGQGLMTWAQLSSIYEPVGGVTREIFGFDTFAGFPQVDEIDNKNTAGIKHSSGDLSIPDAYSEIKRSIELYDQNRFLSQFKKVHLIKGDFLETSELFFNNHPYVIPALLYLDFDLYAPIRKALEVFYKRMPKGSVIAFDEANDATWPGETQAIYEMLDIKKIKFNKVAIDIKISYAVIE